ncbi:winged helix-turn-helix domain-containing protein [Streptomyces sp. NBC_01136]|uniref:winged helix-turn-helix domain-containing protein n=1 Tax=unclassified Streptomyces TaxID=2593676 RepID=UPI00324B65C4|nr:winged helix-turn-helix domain-containing protein [Streptomyces sp. NBC_01136]
MDAGPAAFGWSDQCWTPARIAEIVRRRFGVEYTLAGLTRPGGLAAIARIPKSLCDAGALLAGTALSWGPWWSEDGSGMGVGNQPWEPSRRRAHLPVRESEAGAHGLCRGASTRRMYSWHGEQRQSARSAWGWLWLLQPAVQNTVLPRSRPPGRHGRRRRPSNRHRRPCRPRPRQTSDQVPHAAPSSCDGH